MSRFEFGALRRQIFLFCQQYLIELYSTEVLGSKAHLCLLLVILDGSGRAMGNLRRLSVVPGTGEVMALSTLLTAARLHRSESRRMLKRDDLPTLVVPTM